MGWFEDEYPWVPKVDEAGHEIGPGAVNFTYMACGCPNATDGRGHQTARCRVVGCKAPAILPADCPGPKDQR